MTAKILIVDDEPEVLRLFDQILRKEVRAKELELYCAANGLEALALLAEMPDISLVLTDINMPEMDGLTLLAAIQDLNRIVKTVVISAYSDFVKIRLAMNRGAFDFLTKPIDHEALNFTISRSLNEVAKLKRQALAFKQAQETLEFEALHDRLTGLPNRNAFMRHLVHEIQQAQAHRQLSYTVLFIELQRLNMVNDSFGFLAVDELITQAAKRLQICLTNNGILANFGNNSFVILLCGLQDAAELTPLVKNIQQQMSYPFEVNGYRQYINAIIGIRRLSTNLQALDTPEQVLKDVNTATYYARQNKRGYEVFTPAMQEAAQNRWQLESDLRLAIEHQEFFLNYQPLICLASGELVGFEALLRWQHPSRGLVSPAIFIPLAEETELIVEIGGMVLAQACQQAIAWQQQFPHMPKFQVSVNVSPLQCQHGNLLKQVVSALQATGLPGDMLKLEITESSFSNIEASRQMWQEITDLGVTLSIDDFGTGYSCLSRLHELPISTLKIDQSFVREMDQGQEHQEVIKTILLLAKNLNMNVVAEGVETQAQMLQLQSMGCTFGQGYYFDRPLSSQLASECIAKQSKS